MNQQENVNAEEIDVCRVNMQQILAQYKGRGSKIIMGEVEPYNSSFLEYLKQHGYTEDAEYFFLEGCSYLAAKDYKAIHKYNHKQEKKADIFFSIFNGKRYKSNKANDSQKKVKFILTMLGYYLACRFNETQVIEELAIALTNSCFTVDNKINSYLNKYAPDSFLKPLLKSQGNLPDMKEVIVQPGYYNKFLQLMQAVFADCNIQETPRLAYVRSSLLGEMSAAKATVKTGEEAAAPNPIAEHVEDRAQQVDKQPGDAPQVSDAAPETVEKLQNEIKSLKAGYKKHEEKLNQDLEELRKKLSFLQAAYDKQIAEHEGLRKSYSLLNEEKVRLMGENKNLLQQVEKLQNANKELNDRLSISHTALDKLDEDAEYKQQAALNRIAQRLNIYYRDYLEAADVEMTVDLGINMLETLGDVFGILQKNGINVGNKG